MRSLRSVLIIAFAVLAGSQQSSPQDAWSAQKAVPDSCPMNPRPARPFIPPADYRLFDYLAGEDAPKDFFWIGTEKLWTEVAEKMVWEWIPHSPGHEQDLTAKISWYREGYSWSREPVPKIKVTGKRIDGPAPPLMLPQGPATHIILDDYHGSILTGVYVPAPGCWKITGDYEGDKLSFNVWVVPVKPER